MTDWCTRFRYPAWEHQLREWEHRNDKARMLRWQMRTGKTKAMIDLAFYLHAQGLIDGVIVAGPNNVHLNWARREVPKHAWEGCRYRSVAWSSTESHKVGWVNWFEKLCEPRAKTLDFLMVNFEAFTNDRFLKAFLPRFLKKHRRFLLVVDETHDVRGHSSKRLRELRRLRSRAAFRRGLSGTITDNSPLHAWAQYELLADAALGFGKYKDFEEHFAVKEPQTIFRAGKPVRIMAITGYRNLDELTAAMAKITSVVLREECDDLPELDRQPLRFELTPEQKRVYNAVVDKALARLESGEIIPVKEGGALKSQLQQIASGWYVGEDGEVVEVVPDWENPRLLALRSQVALTGPKTVVFCRFREDIVRAVRACKAAGFKAVHYYGGTRPKDREANLDSFMNDPTVGPFVGQPLACGQGLDLSVADEIIWYSHLDGDLIKKKQADERATLVGGKVVGVTEMVAVGTNDEQLLLDLDEKHRISDEVSGEGLRAFLRRLD